MDAMTNIERFETEIKKIKREGADKLLKYCQTSDFYTAPSSTRFHLSVPGGLLQHSLNVMDALRDILTKNADGTYSYIVLGHEVARISEETLVLITLMHDLCKTHFYTVEMRNKKINGVWQEVPTYSINDEFPYGHGEKSVFMLESMIRLTMEERMAIRHHMGAFTRDPDAQANYGNAVDRWPIVLALHTADMYASHFMEEDTGNKTDW